MGKMEFKYFSSPADRHSINQTLSQSSYYKHEINRSHFLSSSSNHTRASKSRWFVGSSSNRSVGLTNRARAKAILIRQPPEKSFVFVCCMEGVKPRPSRISAALVSALSASRSSSLSKISNNLKEIQHLFVLMTPLLECTYIFLAIILLFKDTS